MKKYSFFIFTTFLFIFSSCKKFLDEKQSSQQAALNSVKACLASMDNSALNLNFPCESEMYADDYLIPDSRWLTLSAELREIYLRSSASQRFVGGNQWLTAYNRIYIVNVVLETLETIAPGSTAKEQGDYNNAKGIALFHRAFNYHQLVSLYAKPYDPVTAGQDPGIPIRLVSDINFKSERGTVKQAYDQIIKDLKASADLLPVNAVAGTRPNKAAAYAALARVYLSMEDYVNAGAAADAALQLNNTLIDYNTVDGNSTTPFDFTNPEAYFHANMNYDPYCYTTAYVDPGLYAQYANNDLRKKVFFKSIGAGIFRFYGRYNNLSPSSVGTWNGLATDEMYLIRAEAYARAGNTSAAMADLNALLRKRWVSGTYTDLTASTPDDALTKVLKERRKELVFRSVRWTDLRRLNKDPRFATTSTRTVNGNTYTLPPNDLRYVILLPKDVVAYSDLAQNPR